MLRAKLALLALGLAMLPGCRLPAQDSDYRDLQAGYALSVPAGWHLTRAYGDVDLVLTPPKAVGMGTRLAIYWDQRKDGETTELQDYAQFRMARFGHFAQKRKLLSQTVKALNDEIAQAVRLEYEYQMNPDQSVRTRSWVMVSERGHYTLSFTAPQSSFEQYLDDWAAFEASFRLLN